jgi:hypothetical protein
MYDKSQVDRCCHSLADTPRSNPVDQFLSSAPRLATAAARTDRGIQLLDATGGYPVEEFRATPETSAQVRSMGGIGHKPLAVISAGQQSSSWLEMQDDLGALS